MTFISYAQNHEDVMLWRALKHIGVGFYIDVGAAHPDEYSVTRAFYDHGWHGINIEPTLAYFRRLAGARPNDLNLNIAVADRNGLSQLEIEGSGRSTLDHQSRTKVCTLADICSRHVTGDVHFLRIDVEGAEAAVLAGADFRTCRPWIIVVEATRPLSTESGHFEWEGLLTSANYRFVYFDGLSRFYIAGERWHDLSPAFAAPPNVFDDFLRAADTEHLSKIIAAELRAAQSETKAAAAESLAMQAQERATRAEATREVLETLSAQAQERAGRAEARWAEVETDRAETAAAHAIALSQIAALKASSSWRLTWPIRAARHMLRGRFGLGLMEAGISAERVERLRRVAGSHGSVPKRLGRIGFYVTARAATRVFPAAFAVHLKRVAPKPWSWLSAHDRAYLVAANPGHIVHSLSANGPERYISRRSPSTVSPPTSDHRTHTVHQFHSGSFTGDAITNAMFLIQHLLRRSGYASEIYVEHRHPDLVSRLFEMTDLPQHDDYVLIVHHSMGYDACEQIIELAARKILVYHNITPPEFLEDFPELIPYAELGRRQLSLLRPHMAAAVADSEFNALELRAHGYEAPVTCPLLFDVDQLIANAKRQGTGHEGAPYTILFVGRVVASKGQADLVDAFARFRRDWAAPCRLVLVGRMAAPDAHYPSEVRRRISLHGLENEVIVAGQVTDDQLHEWYRAADLYVSLSFHEGFGVPLVEAMAHDVPVLAWPAGAIPYTLGIVGELLSDRSPDFVAAAMLRIAREPARRSEMIERQREALGRFRLDHQLPRLIQGLVMAGAAPPTEHDARQVLATHLRFTVTGHISGTYSLAAINRFLALVLEERQPGTVRIVPWENGPSTDLSRIPAGQAAALDILASRPSHVTGPEVVISHHYPVYVPPHRGDLAMALIPWEESLLPAETMRTLNDSFDAVLAPSTHVMKALIDSGLSIAGHLVGQAADLSPFLQLGDVRVSCNRHAGQVFTFLHVSSCFPRKGVDVLLNAYATVFRKGDPVRLVIKGFPNPHNDVPEQIARLLQQDPDSPEIVMINQELDDAAMLDLYREADAMVLPSRGEGFNLPAAEAMAAGIPLIVTGYSGHMDFCGPDEARLLKFRFAPSQSHLAAPGSVWVEPDPSDLAKAMREIFTDFGTNGGNSAIRSARARSAILQRLDSRQWVDRISDVALAALTMPTPSPLRTAWVTTWDIACGVAEYSRFLLETVLGSGLSGMAPPVILCDDRTAASDDGLNVRPAWRLMEPGSMDRLIQAVAVEDPHVLLIQHQPGLIQWSDLARLLNDRRVRDRITVVILHAAARLLEIEEVERAAIVTALSQASRLLVHQVVDLNILNDLGLSANVTLFPHGAPSRFAAPPARPLPPGSTPVIGSYGFFLPGKGIPRLIEATARLRQHWPNLRLHLANAQYPSEVSRMEIERCRRLANSFDNGNFIEWDISFGSHTEDMQTLAKCDLLVLPYDESNESASGALRSAMASGVPVAVTPTAIFQEAGSAVHRFNGFDLASTISGIDQLLRDQAARTSYQLAAAAWVEERSWDVQGQRLRNMLFGLRASSLNFK